MSVKLTVFMFALFWAGAIADYATTVRGLKKGAREGNPIVRRLIDKLPFDTEVDLWIIKTAVFLALVGTQAPTTMYVLAFFIQTLAAVGNNNGWWTKLKKEIDRRF